MKGQMSAILKGWYYGPVGNMPKHYKLKVIEIEVSKSPMAKMLILALAQPVYKIWTSLSHMLCILSYIII